MSSSRIVPIAAVLVAGGCFWPGAVLAQQVPGNSRPQQGVGPRGVRERVTSETLQSINDDYNRELIQLERQRLGRLARLAASQAPKEAGETYETLFRLAIANNLFVEADPSADQVLRSPANAPPVVRFLAETINVIAAADRGQYDESLAALRKLVGPAAKPGHAADPSARLDTPSLLIICGAYYQRLIQGERFDVARKAFQLIEQEAGSDDVKEFCKSRLRHLSLIGKPAPAIQGTDVDGKSFALDQLKGDVVLVDFWASWCLPSSAEVAWLDQVYEANRDRGFRIVAINVDTLQNGGTKLEAVMPGLKRFLLEHNVRWPNLVNGDGPHNYAAAYGVTEIPANVLIGRDGTVIHLDLTRKNLAQVVARAVAPRK